MNDTYNGEKPFTITDGKQGVDKKIIVVNAF